jgi:uncharacterized tellurite resistance protein B-like protein
MNTLTKNDFGLYQNLGKLFYAVAVCDGTVNPEEIQTFNRIIKTYWSHYTNNEEALTTMQSTFEWLTNDNEYNSDICFKEFVNYKNKHQDLFNDTALIQLILKTINGIASSFSSVNKSELIILAKIEMMLKS